MPVIGLVQVGAQAMADRYTYVLNESAREHLGWEQASGKLFSAFGKDSRRAISGIIDDFYYMSLHTEVKPCLLASFFNVIN